MHYSLYLSHVCQVNNLLLWGELHPLPPHSHAEALTPIMMVLGGGAFGRQLDLHEIVRVLPLWR